MTTSILLPPPPSLVKTEAISPATYSQGARYPARYLTCRISFCRDRSLGPGRNPLLSDFTLLGSWGIPWNGRVNRAACQTCLPVGSSVVNITHYILSLARATSFGREMKTYRKCVGIRFTPAGCYGPVQPQSAMERNNNRCLGLPVSVLGKRVSKMNSEAEGFYYFFLN